MSPRNKNIINTKGLSEKNQFMCILGFQIRNSEFEFLSTHLNRNYVFTYLAPIHYLNQSQIIINLNHKENLPELIDWNLYFDIAINCQFNACGAWWLSWEMSLKYCIVDLSVIIISLYCNLYKRFCSNSFLIRSQENGNDRKSFLASSVFRNTAFGQQWMHNMNATDEWPWDLILVQLLRSYILVVFATVGWPHLSDCGLMMPYGDRDLGQHWLR